MRAKHDWFLVCFPLVEKSGASFANQSLSVVKQNHSKHEITFDTQLKTTLRLVSYILVYVTKVGNMQQPVFVVVLFMIAMTSTEIGKGTPGAHVINLD